MLCGPRLTRGVRLRAAAVGGRLGLWERRAVPVSGVWHITRGSWSVGTPEALRRVPSSPSPPGACCRVRRGVPVGRGRVPHQGDAGRRARVACQARGGLPPPASHGAASVRRRGWRALSSRPTRVQTGEGLPGGLSASNPGRAGGRGPLGARRIVALSVAVPPACAGVSLSSGLPSHAPGGGGGGGPWGLTRHDGGRSWGRATGGVAASAAGPWSGVTQRAWLTCAGGDTVPPAHAGASAPLPHPAGSRCRASVCLPDTCVAGVRRGPGRPGVPKGAPGGP